MGNISHLENSPPNAMKNVGALGLIGFGGLLFISQFFGGFWNFFGEMWPLFIAGFGGIFLAIALFGSRALSGFIFPGMIITGTGAILTFQALTDRWESWAYMWTLYPVFVGLGLIFQGMRTDNADEVKVGRAMSFGGLMGFIVMSTLFEVVFFESAWGLNRWMMPLMLIGVGAFLLTRGRGGMPKPFYGKHKPKRGLSHSDELRRQIDAALAEDDNLIVDDYITEKPKV